MNEKYIEYLKGLPKTEIIERYLQVTENIEDIVSENKDLRKQLRIYNVVSSLPSKEEMEIKLSYLMKHKTGSFKTEYDKITFKFGFRTCFYWLSKKMNN